MVGGEEVWEERGGGEGLRDRDHIARGGEA